MECAICGKLEEEARLYDGIYQAKISKVCKDCAVKEGIPVLKKPSVEQLDVADKRYSVRERMERMAGHLSPSELSKDQLVAHRNLNKLRVLPKKQGNDKLHDDYYWRVIIARRREKLSISQLSQKSGVSEEIIYSIEKGQLPANFEDAILRLENSLGIELMKDHRALIKFNRARNTEKDILKEVGEKIGIKPRFEEEEELEEVNIEDDPERDEKLAQISRGEIDFSKRENLDKITLSDLQEIKKQREMREKEKARRKQEETMMGDELELEELDLEEV
jgi:ribosome-binding protein aMBF1 (putative translation factor)